jgi:hypothetical protein
MDQEQTNAVVMEFIARWLCYGFGTALIWHFLIAVTIGPVHAFLRMTKDVSE